MSNRDEMILIDTHAHLYVSQFDDDRNEMISRATDHGVRRFYLPNIDVASIPEMHRILANHGDKCYGLMGLHPCSVDGDYINVLSRIKEELDDGDYVGVGEIGIDLYWDKTYTEEQVKAFELQIDWALDRDQPIVIHSRDSLDLTISSVSKKQNGNLRGIFHCFTGTLDQAKSIMDLGFYMGLGGVLTFKNGGVDKIIHDVPMESIVLETDSPYLAPVPYRGKRNEPLYIVNVAQRLADLKNLSLMEVASITTANAIQIFHPS